MKQPIVPMTKEKWIAFCKSLKSGDELHVFCDDITGIIIRELSEDEKTPDTNGFVKFLQPVHTLRYFGLGRGATLESDPKGTRWHLIDEYRDRIMKGDTRIIVYRHPDLTMTQFEKFKWEADRCAKNPYGFGALIGLAFIRLTWNTPIGSLWRWAKWQTPFCSRESPVCSQEVRLQKDQVKEFFDVMIKLSTWQQNTPQRLLDETKALTIMVLDSFAIAKNLQVI